MYGVITNDVSNLLAGKARIICNHIIFSFGIFPQGKAVGSCMLFRTCIQRRDYECVKLLHNYFIRFHPRELSICENLHSFMYLLIYLLPSCFKPVSSSLTFSSPSCFITPVEFTGTGICNRLHFSNILFYTGTY